MFVTLKKEYCGQKAVTTLKERRWLEAFLATRLTKAISESHFSFGSKRFFRFQARRGTSGTSRHLMEVPNQQEQTLGPICRRVQGRSLFRHVAKAHCRE